MRKKAAAAASGERAAGFAALRDPPDHLHGDGGRVWNQPSSDTQQHKGDVTTRARRLERMPGPVIAPIVQVVALRCAVLCARRCSCAAMRHTTRPNLAI